jgi:glycosyltransferase involved in cell wall biosynthesis
MIQNNKLKNTWQRIRLEERITSTAVLVAAHTAPLPTVSGGAVYLANTLLPLAEKYTLHLLLIGDEQMLQDLQKHLDLYDRYFHSVTFVHRENPGKGFIAKTIYAGERILLGLPFLDINYFSRAAIKAAHGIIKKFSISFMELHSTHLAFLKHYFPSIPALLVSHNIESELFPFWLRADSSMAEKIAAFFSRRNARRVEIENIWDIEAMTFISPRDMAKVSAPVHKYHLPLTFPKTDLTPVASKSKTCRILWVGGFWWWPNAEGMEWFVREVLPLIHDRLDNLDIVIDIVGGNPSKSIQSAHNGKTICVHGFVDDLGSFFAHADLLMVPLLSGGGVRVKIVEAMSKGITVLSTPKGCEGLDCVHGESIWMAETAESFAQAIIKLTHQQEIRLALRDGALRYINEYHNHDKALSLKEAIYNELERKQTGRAPLWLTCKRFIKKIPGARPMISYFRSRRYKGKGTIFSPYEGLTYLKPIECIAINKIYTQIPKDSFSVIIPVKNEAKGIVSFLRSLAVQSVLPKEYIIIDHNSEDGTTALIEEERKRLALPIRLLQSRNYCQEKGIKETTLAQNRNIAVGTSESEIILFMDAGTQPRPDFLANLVGPLLEYPDADLSGAIYHVTDSALEHKFVYDWDSNYMLWNEFLPPCRGVAVRRDLFDKAGGLPEFLTFAGEDTLFDVNYRRLSRKWVFNKSAITYWDAPNNDKSMWRKFYRYGIGDGESGIGDFNFYSVARAEYLGMSDVLNKLPDIQKAMFYGYLSGKTQRGHIDRERRSIRETVLLIIEHPLVCTLSSLNIIKNLISGNRRV